MSATHAHAETTFNVRLTEQETQMLRQISQIEHLPEDALLRKWILDGLNRMRLERACTAYEKGDLNLSGAAHYAGVGVEQMMRELTRRGISHSPSTEQFADGLDTLADLFGKEELRAAATQVRQQKGQVSPDKQA
jgi:predicted HTH domain antitoxin